METNETNGTMPEPDDLNAIEPELPPEEESPAPPFELSPETSEYPVIQKKLGKSSWSKARSFIFSLLLCAYIVTNIGFAYWYWARPVRQEQFDSAYEWWAGFAEIYSIPVPEDERYF